VGVCLVLGGCQRGGPATEPPAPPVLQAASAEPAGPVAPPEPLRAAAASARSTRPVPLEVCRGGGEPLDAARTAYDSGHFEQALSCAAQAAAFYPELPQAHSERGAALSALGRFDEAQLAYARALALQPDHLDALLGAAHLYAVSLPSTREHDELAALYAARGLELSRLHRDDRLTLQFALVSAMALNDLGRAGEALVRADEVLAREPRHREARYERAVALFELCEFVQARAAFSSLLADRDRGAHAHHHLGLLLEREGRDAEAEKHFAAARKRAPADFPAPQAVSAEEFRAEVARAVAQLPEDMRRDLVGIPVEAEELPLEEDLLGGDPPLSPTILGLFRGPPLGERCEPVPGRPCRSVALYRRNLARAVHSREELSEQIRVTLLHEVGHLRGEDDHELAARGLE
jgi:predicted Zn-dependent protease with MMP-like domain/Flp pilus assembly protein TadD